MPKAPVCPKCGAVAVRRFSERSEWWETLHADDCTMMEGRVL